MSHPEGPVVAVQLTRQPVIDVLRKAGFPDLAEEALHALPDPVDREQTAAWGVQHGVNIGELINRSAMVP